MLNTWSASPLPPPRGPERGSEPSPCAHLALEQLVVPLYLQHVARPAAHGAPGAMVAVRAGAVEGRVLHGQLGAVSGLTREVHAAGEESNQRIRGGWFWPARKIKADGSPLQDFRRLSQRRGRRLWRQQRLPQGQIGEAAKPGFRSCSKLYVVGSANLAEPQFSNCETGVMTTASVHCVSHTPGASASCDSTHFRGVR